MRAESDNHSIREYLPGEQLFQFIYGNELIRKLFHFMYENELIRKLFDCYVATPDCIAAASI